MKIAIVGCGAVGSFYGARLARAGHETHFLLRSDYAAVRQAGVQIHSPEGDFIAHPVAAASPSEIGPAELVIVALKTTANHRLPELIPPLLGPRTRIVTLQNGLGNEEQLAALAPEPGSVLGGLCFVCLNRTAPGVVHHLAHGDIVLGEHGRAPGPATAALVEEFKRAGIRCRLTPNLAQAHWEKLVWNVPFNGLGVAGIAGHEALESGEVPVTLSWRRTLPTDELLADERWSAIALELMQEVVAAGRALGYPVAGDFPAAMMSRTRSMGPYRASTLLDFEAGAPLELESLFLEPLRQAQSAGLATPRLHCLCAALTELDRRRRARGVPNPAG